MPNDCANGSTFTFDAVAVGEVRDISFSESANEVDVTTLADSEHLYCPGATDIECTIEIVGSITTSAIAIGDAGALAISWNDSGSESIGNAVCTGRETTGSLDTEIATSYTFKPTPS